MATELQAKPRNNEKKSTIKKIRKEGNVPAVVYGNGLESTAISFNNSEFIKVIREVGRNGIITLKLENEDYPVMLYDMQYDNMKDEIVHVDFYKVDMSSEVDVDVTVNLVGEASGQKDGGIVQQGVYELNVRALPTEIPEAIDVNIEELNIGDSIQVSDLQADSNYEILTDPEETIVSVTPPQQEEPEEVDDEQEQEPELVDGGGEDEEGKQEEQ